jgi:proteasome assembly chaperone (PAC2) family protein
MQGTCLLGETSGYVVDAKASKSILESLLSIVGIMIDMTNLDKRAKDTEMLIQTMQQQVAGRALEGRQPGVPHKPDTGYIS